MIILVAGYGLVQPLQKALACLGLRCIAVGFADWCQCPQSLSLDAREDVQLSASGLPKGYGVGRGLRLAARAHGTPLYVWENGKVVALEP